jgi:acetyl-CoA carboxylase beta subunit
MKEVWKIFVFLAILSCLSAGCAGMSKDTAASKDLMIKCPKCGAVFSTKEGMETFKNIPEPSATRK